MDKAARETARRLCDTATLGPWESTACDDGLMMVATTGDTICFGDPNHQEPDDTANGAFIAAARTLLPQALDALDAADVDNARLQARVSELEAAQGWRPIESAPKDTAIMLYDAGYYVGHFNTILNAWIGLGRGTPETLAWKRNPPTHFKLLPAPPVGDR